MSVEAPSYFYYIQILVTKIAKLTTNVDGMDFGYVFKKIKHRSCNCDFGNLYS